MGDIRDIALVGLLRCLTALASDGSCLAIDGALAVGVASTSSLSIGASQARELGLGLALALGSVGVAGVSVVARIGIVTSVCVLLRRIGVLLLGSSGGAVVLLRSGSGTSILLCRSGVGSVRLGGGSAIVLLGRRSGSPLLLRSGLEVGGVVCDEVVCTDFDGEGNIVSLDRGGYGVILAH